ncbi:MAG TPA: PhzF family phenazine biosynthesis protein [Anaerolineae bacterium]|nr:PhzF family phenazine biosynthesis protein [Anaerolineae bacterium]
MTTYPFTQVDAFTDKPLAGNPCAILFDTDDLSDGQMLAIAKEMNLSETAFVRHSDIADFGVRYFTPAEEIPLAGHPTIATTHALIDDGRLPLTDPKTSITFELQVGPIEIEIFAEDGRPPRIVMSQKKPQFGAIHNPAQVMPAFGLSPDDLWPDAPIQTVSTGTPQLMIPLRGLEALRRAQVNIPVYAALRETADFFSPHLFCLEGVTPNGRTFARHFGLPPDTMEDPFTGSATGGMAAYLWHYGLIDQPVFVAEQGHWLNRPGQAFVEVIGPPDDMETVKVGGTAVTVLRGELTI